MQGSFTKVAVVALHFQQCMVYVNTKDGSRKKLAVTTPQLIGIVQSALIPTKSWCHLRFQEKEFWPRITIQLFLYLEGNHAKILTWHQLFLQWVRRVGYRTASESQRFHSYCLSLKSFFPRESLLKIKEREMSEHVHMTANAISRRGPLFSVKKASIQKAMRTNDPQELAGCHGQALPAETRRGPHATRWQCVVKKK